MTAQDDYPELVVLTSGRLALEEIDRLRAELAKVTEERNLNAGIALREQANAHYYREQLRRER